MFIQKTCASAYIRVCVHHSSISSLPSFLDSNERWFFKVQGPQISFKADKWWIHRMTAYYIQRKPWKPFVFERNAIFRRRNDWVSMKGGQKKCGLVNIHMCVENILRHRMRTFFVSRIFVTQMNGDGKALCRYCVCAWEYFLSTRRLLFFLYTIRMCNIKLNFFIELIEKEYCR